MPALTISDEELMEGMNIIEAAVKKILKTLEKELGITLRA